MVRRLTPPSCPIKANLTDDKIPMFPYITAFYSLSTVLLSRVLSTLLKLKVKCTLLYYDACVNYAMLC